MKTSVKLIAALLILVGLLLLNYIAGSVPVRIDATADKLYTLSDGTRSLLKKIEEPVKVQFYFSRDTRGLPISYKNYADRVKEMLEQYVRASGGKLTLDVINPEQDTPEEEQATAAGLQPQVMPGTGEQFYFGVVATQADQQKVLSAMQPDREQFLEYDLSELIYSVQQVEKKKLGLITSLPLKADNSNPMMMMQRQQPQQDQVILTEWERTFEIVPVDATATELPEGLDALAIIHPENLSEKLQFAIDQFILSGKPALLAVDPYSEHFRRQGGQQAMFGGPTPNISSDMPAMLKAYGVAFSDQQVVGDLQNAAQVNTGSGIVRFPVWVLLGHDDLNDKAQPTAQLQQLLFIEPGSLSPITGVGTTFTPLVQTSELSGDLPTSALQFAQPDEISRQIVTTGKKTIAALVQGKFKTAFPNGEPKEEPKKDADGKDTPPTPPPADKPAAPALTESTGTSTLIVVADTDFLTDDFSVRKMNFLGQQAVEPLNDNLYFASNCVEYIAGSSDLISIRGKGSAQRPFTVVEKMQATAQKKYQDQLNELEDKVKDVQTKLTQLQAKRTDGGRLVATPEMQAEIEKFQKQEADARHQRREIRRALRVDIDALGNKLLWINILTMPLVLGALATFVLNKRRR